MSGTHAEFQYRNGSWWIKDLGSSNGTWIEGQRVTERMLRSGEVVQLGVNGPRLQVEYFDATPPVGVPDVPIAAGAPEGRTVVMMMGGGAPSGGGAPAVAGAPMAGYAPAAAPKKKGGILKVLLILFLLFGILIVAAIGGAVMLRKRNAAKKPALTPAQVQAQKAAEAIKTQIEQTKQTMAQAQASLQRVEQTKTAATSTELSPEGEDLKRQLQDQQRMIDELTRQLQEQNDALRPPPPQTQTPQRSQSQVRPVIPAQPTERKRISNEEGIAEFERRAAAQQQQQQQQAVQQAKVTPTPATAGKQAPPTAPVAQLDLSPLPVNKVLKKRISVKPSTSEIPLPGLPGGASRDVAKLIVTALTSAGDYIALDRGADASISVEVTNFKDDKKTTVDTRKITQTAGAFGSLAGVDVPDSPANVKSGSRDSEIQIYVRAYDRSSSQIAETQALATSKASKTQFKVESVSLGQEALAGDNTLADVTRKVAADSIDAIRADLDRIPWTANVSDQKKDGAVLIDCGGPCGVEVGDVFDIYDANRPVARVRVTFIDAKQSTSEIISGDPAAKLKGKIARYAGRETDSPGTAYQTKPKFLQLRQNSKVYDGPGRSFRELRELRSGTRVRYLYSVGPWAKATDGKSTFWVPMAVAQIVT